MIRRVKFDKNNSTSHETKELVIPTICPMCHHAIDPVTLSANRFDDEPHAPVYAVSFGCTQCHKVFIAHYGSESNEAVYLAPKSVENRTFDARLSSLSPDFVAIYNQALAAECYDLTEITGMAYRKALEFLIKDYLVSIEPEKEQEIREMFLGNCIKEKISSSQLKSVASRTVWLGNDFAHYTRKYNELEVSDLKRFIDAVVHWILMEITTSEILSLERR